MKLSLATLFLSILLLNPPSSAAPDVAPLVRRFEAAYHSSRTLRASFLEKYFDNGKEVRSEAGVAYFARPGKMRWEYASPEVNLYVVDGKWAWFYVPEDHTVTRIHAKESADARTPLALLAGEMKVSRVCKAVEADSAARPSNPLGVVLRCTLRRSSGEGSGGTRAGNESGVSSADSYALFELNPANGELLRVVVADPGGVQVEFRFANWEFNPRVEDAKFHFQAPRGVAIVDGDLAASGDVSGAKQVH
jgi:outer membrane lipoprotein carrier protein